MIDFYALRRKVDLAIAKGSGQRLRMCAREEQRMFFEDELATDRDNANSLKPVFQRPPSLNFGGLPGRSPLARRLEHRELAERCSRTLDPTGKDRFTTEKRRNSTFRNPAN